MSVGEIVAGISGLALVLVLFLPWYGGDQLVELPSGTIVTTAGTTQNAWESFAFLDLVLFVCGSLGLARLIGAATNADAAGLPVPSALTVIGAGAVAVVVIFFRLMDAPDLGDAVVGTVETDAGRRIGIFLALIAAAGMSLGGYLGGSHESGSRDRVAPNRNLIK